MATLIDVNSLTKSYGVRTLFTDLRFTIPEEARIGLIGPNGAGKSTLLRIIAGQVEADGGEIIRKRDLRVAFLEQQPQLEEEADIKTNVLAGIEEQNSAVASRLADELISRFGLDNYGGQTVVNTLSGGWRKRVALAREVARRPDLLLLDEPTNHLDIESIIWLENFLAQAKFSVLTITHDRLFLQNVANVIWDLDRRNPRGLIAIEGDYATFIERKEALLDAQERQEQSLRNKLRRETEWLRQGAKARSTKQKARIDRAGDLAVEVRDVKARNVSRVAKLDFQAAESGKHRLIEAIRISKGYGERQLFSKFSLLVNGKSRIGLLGRNGCGKSTLIRVLLGSELPDEGTIKRADQLSVAYFEQGRGTLHPQHTPLEVLAPDGDHVFFGGQFVHVRSYLDRFLFGYEQMQMPVGQLSGGEQSRLLLAKLMLTEANLLVLDEPTNDLDIPTLDVLEDCLSEFTGAVILVSHDRYFLDHVAKEIIAFIPAGSDGVNEQKLTTFASLEQWEGAIAQAEAERRRNSKDTERQVAAERPRSGRKDRLSYNEQRELSMIESTIEAAETELAQRRAATLDPAVFTSPDACQEAFLRVAELEQRVEELYARWAELDAKATTGK